MQFDEGNLTRRQRGSLKHWLQRIALLALGGAHADTLKKIKDTGSVTVGTRESSGALAYTHAGYNAGDEVALREKLTVLD